jgi:hypothetical protein
VVEVNVRGIIVNAVVDHKVALDPTVHREIIARMTQFCATANVPEKFVRLSMKGFCSDVEIEWVRQFNQNLRAGRNLIFTGKNKNHETKCMAITGTLVRNFVDARLMTLRGIIDNPDVALEPRVLIVPNLYVTSFGKQLTAWQIQAVYDMLLNRLVANKLLVAYVESMSGLQDDYGSVFYEHLKEHSLLV